MNLELKKTTMKCLVWSVALYAAEMWTLTQTDRRLEAFEMWIWRRMEKIRWLDKVTNEEVLRIVNKDRQILNSIWQRKHRWIGHVLRYGGLLHEIFEGSWQTIAMLHSNGQLKTERDGDTEKGCQKPTVHQKATERNWTEHIVRQERVSVASYTRSFPGEQGHSLPPKFWTPTYSGLSGFVKQGGSPDEARLEQTQYPFHTQPIWRYLGIK